MEYWMGKRKVVWVWEIRVLPEAEVTMRLSW